MGLTLQPSFYKTAYEQTKRLLFLIPFLTMLLYDQVIWSGLTLFGTPLPDLHDKIQFPVMNLLMIRVIFFQKLSWKQAVTLAVMTALFRLCAFRADYRNVLMIWIMIMAAKDQDFDEVIRCAFWVLLVSTVTLMLLCFAGVLEDATQLREKGSDALRHSFGFNHPNSLGTAYMHIYACFLYLRRKKLNLLDPLIGVLCFLLILFVPISRAAAVCTLMMAGFSALSILTQKKGLSLRKKIIWAAIGLALFFNIFCVVYSIFYTVLPGAEKADKLLNHRLSYAQFVYDLFGIKFLGQTLPKMHANFKIDGKKYYMRWLDSSYMDLLLRYGLWSYLGLTGLYHTAMIKLRKTGSLMLIGIMTAYAAHAIMESTLFTMRFSIFFLPLAIVLYGTQSLFPHSEQE